jgi:hypothetical protein
MTTSLSPRTLGIDAAPSAPGPRPPISALLAGSSLS